MISHEAAIFVKRPLSGENVVNDDMALYDNILVILIMSVLDSIVRVPIRN